MPSEPAQRLPVISLTLVVGRPIQFTFVTRGNRADSAIRDVLDPEPIPGQLVSLRVIDPDGAVHPLAPDNMPGRHRVDLDPRAGGTYRLEGIVDGHAVSATTVVPSAFQVLEPAGDTIHTLRMPGPFGRVAIPLQFSGNDVAFLEGRVVDPNGRVLGGAVLDRSADTLQIGVPGPGTWKLEILAYNRAGYDWLKRTNPLGNVNGAFGGFMAAIQYSTVLVVE